MKVNRASVIIDKFHDQFPECPYTYFTDFSESGEFLLCRGMVGLDVIIAGSRQGYIRSQHLNKNSKWRYIEDALVINWLDCIHIYDQAYSV